MSIIRFVDMILLPPWLWRLGLESLLVAARVFLVALVCALIALVLVGLGWVIVRSPVVETAFAPLVCAAMNWARVAWIQILESLFVSS